MGSLLDPVAAVDKTFLYIIGFSLAFLTFITLLMIYFVFHYRASRNPEPSDIRGNLLLELVWMVIPTFIALSMFYFGWQSYLGLRNVPDDALNIDVTGQMFYWSFAYPEGKQSDGVMVVPEGRAVKLNITSLDVNHSLSIPSFRIKMDAVPGMTTYAWFKADKPGTYNILCTEYCGVAHSEMLAELRIVPEAEYQTWLEKEPEPAPRSTTEQAAVPTTPQFDAAQLFEIDEKMNFKWRVEGDQLNIILSAPTAGWVAVGFNPEQAMKGANFILGAVVEGQVLMSDHFGSGYTKHEEDRTLGGQANVTNVHGREESGVTEIGFSIPLDSGDAMDGSIASGDNTLLLAYSAGQDSFRMRHAYRGKFKVNLQTGEYQKLN
jgi:cytochrome c oxidase subunit 2